MTQELRSQVKVEKVEKKVEEQKVEAKTPTQVSTSSPDLSGPALPAQQGRHVVTPPNRVPNARSLLDEANDYLTSKGWELNGFNEQGVALWVDPISNVSQKAEARKACEVPITGGGKEDIVQMFCPPVPWTYSTEQAMFVQKQREKKLGPVKSTGNKIYKNDIGQVVVVPENPEAIAAKIRVKEEMLVSQKREVEQLKELLAAANTE